MPNQCIKYRIHVNMKFMRLIQLTEHRSSREVLDIVDEQKLGEHHPTTIEKLVRSCVEKWIPSVYSLRRQNGRDKNSWETEWYNDRLDEEQRRGIWSYKEKSLWQRRLASLEAWTCMKRQSTQEGQLSAMLYGLIKQLFSMLFQYSWNYDHTALQKSIIIGITIIVAYPSSSKHWRQPQTRYFQNNQVT